MNNVVSPEIQSDDSDFENVQFQPGRNESNNHPAHPSQQFRCSCGKSFKARTSVYKHRENCGKTRRAKRKCYVPNCELVFYHERKLVGHLVQDHDIAVTSNEQSFGSFGEFMRWKEREQESTFAFFTKQTAVAKRGDCKYSYFICQHDGSSRKLPAKTSRRHRRGTVKIGEHCPARLLVKEDCLTNAVSVRYIASHSHALTFENTKFQPMSTATKSIITDKLALGVPAKQVLESLRDTVGVRDNRSDSNNLSKDSLIPLRIIKDMERRVRLSKRLHTDDAQSVMLLVQKLQNEKYDPVLIYKPMGSPAVVGCDELDTLPDFDNLFLLGIQTQAQRDCLQKFANKILCIDATHCTNQYGFQLLNLVVPDECGKGYPVAHFISNRMDEQVLHFFFQALKLKLPDLVINAVMTDDDYAPWNALVSVFGDTPKHLLCTWHILRAWSRRLHSETASDKALYDEMFTALRLILYCSDEQNFKLLVEAFCKKYQLVAESFVNYFQSYYLNRPEVWALCYRKFAHGKTDTNMLVESFHNRIKTFYMNRRPNRRLDDLVILC
jgi:hypothetical protein